MFKSCGCLIGIILGFLLGVIVACVIFEKKPSDIQDICLRYWNQWVNGDAAAAVNKAVDKAADKAYQEIRK